MASSTLSPASNDSLPSSLPVEMAPDLSPKQAHSQNTNDSPTEIPSLKSESIEELAMDEILQIGSTLSDYLTVGPRTVSKYLL
jgi:hypothetical protein